MEEDRDGIIEEGKERKCQKKGESKRKKEDSFSSSKHNEEDGIGNLECLGNQASFPSCFFYPSFFPLIFFIFW